MSGGCEGAGMIGVCESTHGRAGRMYGWTDGRTLEWVGGRERGFAMGGERKRTACVESTRVW